jgi:hypothetical protein
MTPGVLMETVAVCGSVTGVVRRSSSRRDGQSLVIATAAEEAEEENGKPSSVNPTDTNTITVALELTVTFAWKGN